MSKNIYSINGEDFYYTSIEDAVDDLLCVLWDDKFEPGIYKIYESDLSQAKLTDFFDFDDMLSRMEESYFEQNDDIKYELFENASKDDIKLFEIQMKEAINYWAKHTNNEPYSFHVGPPKELLVRVINENLWAVIE